MAINDTIVLINFTALVTCFLFILVLFVVAACKKTKTMMTLPFLTLCYCDLFVLFCGAGAWLSVLEEIDTRIYYVFRVLDFATVFALTIVYKWYVDVYVDALKDRSITRRRRTPRITSIMYIVSTVLNLVVFAASPWTEWFYSFGFETGIFEFKPAYAVLLVLNTFWYFVAVAKIVENRRYIEKSNMIILLAIAVVPCIMYLTDIFTNLSLGYISTALLIQLFYVKIENAQGERLMEFKNALIEKEKKMGEIEYGMAMSQLQPHFLYNTLSSISFLCTEKPEEAALLTNDFSEYLQMNMQSINSMSPISFEKELGHVKTYLYIEKLRFQKRLVVEYDIQTTDFMIPALVLQTIVENAVRYGVNARYEPTVVRIETMETVKEYVVRVSDDGPGFDVNVQKDDGRKHIGISGSQFKLASMVNGRLNIESTIGKGTVVSIYIPKEVTKE